MRMTPAKLRAQRANARLARGPRTQEGRRRSALNRRRLPLASVALVTGQPSGGDLKELQRLWRDLLALFWFVDPELEFLLETVAWEWWRKLKLVRSGMPESSWLQEGRVEQALAAYIGKFNWRNVKGEYWLRKYFGRGCEHDMQRLRASVEARLPLFHKIKAGELQKKPFFPETNPKL